MSIRYVDDAAGLDGLRETLEASPRVALDLEAAGYHRYSDRVCLIQLTAHEETFLVDPLAVDPAAALKSALEDPSTEVIMHGADFDVRLLRRDLDIGLEGLFDTQIAAALLGMDAIGLSSLLESVLSVDVSKKYQKADWAKRPLPEPMLTYAAHDTLHLQALADELGRRLESAGRWDWALEEFQEQQKVRFEADASMDLVVRVKAARDLDPREVDRLREALEWRDEIARADDRAPFRVAGDGTLVEAARHAPTSVQELEEIRGMNRALARGHGEALLKRFRAVDQIPQDRLRGYPPRAPGVGNGGRPPPDVEERMVRLKEVRNRRAASMGLDRGTLLPNATLQRLAERMPTSLDEMATVGGMRRWQTNVLGTELLTSM